MSDVPPEQPPTSVADLSDPMARFDAVLQPYVERLGLGVITEHALAGFARVLRAAVAAALGPAPEPPPPVVEEPHPEAAEMEAPPEPESLPAPPVNVFS